MEAETKKYNASDLIEKVKELVKANPNNRYAKIASENPFEPLCMYTKGANSCSDAVGCIMGQAIIALYPELEEELKEIDKDGGTIGDILRRFNFAYSYEQREYLTYIQNNQDQEKEWCRCL